MRYYSIAKPMESNIKIQLAGVKPFGDCSVHFPAADLER